MPTQIPPPNPDDPYLTLPPDVSRCMDEVQAVCEKYQILPKGDDIVWIDRSTGNGWPEVGVYFDRMRELTVAWLNWYVAHEAEMEAKARAAVESAAAAKKRKIPEGMRWEFHAPTTQWFLYHEGHWIGAIHRHEDDNEFMCGDGDAYPTIDEAKGHCEQVAAVSLLGDDAVVIQHASDGQSDPQRDLVRSLAMAIREGRVNMMPVQFDR